MSEGGLEEYLRLAAAAAVLAIWWFVTRRKRQSASVRADLGERIVDFAYALVNALVLMPVASVPLTDASPNAVVGLTLGLSILTFTFFVGFALLRALSVQGITANPEAGTFVVVMLAMLVLLIVAALVMIAW